MLDLNDDCQFLVLQRLDFLDLLALAETNHRYKFLASQAAQSVFRNKMVQICLQKPSHYFEPINITITDDHITIDNFTIAEQVLKNFGHHIQKLELGNHYNTMINETKLIYQLVNLYCSETLNEIRLVNSVKNHLNEFTNTFDAVEFVHVLRQFENERKLNEVFPSVRRLHLELNKINKTDAIIVKYPKLEHLIFVMPKYGSGPISIEQATILLRKNSHIQGLELVSASSALMAAAGNTLPDIQFLNLTEIQCKYGNESIIFGNVKLFETIGSCVNCLFSKAKFGKVEELTLSDLGESMFGETGFFENNKNMKKLRLINNGMHFSHIDFHRLARANTTLQDILIDFVYLPEVESFLELMTNNQQLERLEIVFCSEDVRNTASLGFLEAGINNEWSMNEFERTIILERNRH